MRIRVDPDACQGHNRCKAIAPDLFDLDDHGNASAHADASVGPEQEEKARLAIANFPELALSDPDAVTWAGGQVRGPCSIPVVLPA